MAQGEGGGGALGVEVFVAEEEQFLAAARSAAIQKVRAWPRCSRPGWAKGRCGRGRRSRKWMIRTLCVNFADGLTFGLFTAAERRESGELAGMKKLLSLVALIAATVTITMTVMQFSSAKKVQAQDWAKTRMEASPRHHEYVAVKSGGRTLNTLVVYPEVSNKAPVVVLIHEIYGASDWAKEMADEVAAQGYIAVLPDLVSGMGPNGGGTEAFASQNDVTPVVSKLDDAAVMADLNAAADYSVKLPAASGKLYVAGFCWGGGKSFNFATHRKDLSGAFVFYGTPPPAAAMANITAPVYGFYAGNDARISATVPQTKTDMAAAKKSYESVIYDGAGHGFMRAGEQPDATAPNKAARDQAFARMLAVLKNGK